MSTTGKLTERLRRLDSSLRDLHQRRAAAMQAQDAARQRALEHRIDLLCHARVQLSEQQLAQQEQTA